MRESSDWVSQRSKGISEKASSLPPRCCAASRDAQSARSVRRVTEDMVTSIQMRGIIPLSLVLFLLVSGICGGLCFAQAPVDGVAHSCCHHGKGHCGHAASSIDGHAAVTAAKVAPIVPAAPLMARTFAVFFVKSVAAPQFEHFSPLLRSSVLRL